MNRDHEPKTLIGHKLLSRLAGRGLDDYPQIEEDVLALERLSEVLPRKPKEDGWHTHHVCGGQLRELRLVSPRKVGPFTEKMAYCPYCNEWAQTVITTSRELEADLAKMAVENPQTPTSVRSRAEGVLQQTPPGLFLEDSNEAEEILDRDITFDEI